MFNSFKAHNFMTDISILLFRGLLLLFNDDLRFFDDGLVSGVPETI